MSKVTRNIIVRAEEGEPGNEVDGVSGDQHIANLFSRTFEGLFNKKCSSSRSDFLSCVLASLSNSVLLEVSLTEEEVFDAISAESFYISQTPLGSFLSI